MKNLITLLLMVLVITSCSKTINNYPNPNIPTPEDPNTISSFRIELSGLSVYQNVPNNLTAKIILDNISTNSENISISVPVINNQKYITDKISLPKGNYKIKQLTISDASLSTYYATPILGSEKATLVNRPLSISFTLEDKQDKSIIAEVILVTNKSNPESFGYPSGSFGIHTPQPDPISDKKIFIQPSIKVGEVIYDSVPVQLIVKSWNAQNELTYNIHYLPAGKQAVYLSGKAIKHQLSISKWGVTDELVLLKNDVQENSVYILGGNKAPKMLKTVYERKEVNGALIPITKTDYEYSTDGILKQKTVWGKRDDLSNYMVHRDVYEYTGKHITKIRRYNEINELIKTTNIQYNTTGKVQYMEELQGDKFIKADVMYIPLASQTGIAQDFQIDINYNFEHGYFTEHYSKTMSNGVVISDIKSRSHNYLEQNLYSYDFEINPYVHLNIPDLSLSMYTKHNIKFQWTTWYAQPEHEAYSFNTNYIAGGYPKEQIISYRSYKTKVETHKIRTEFVYF